ncbi:MAG: hypothetical protein R3257_01235, partial [bacterium]|nr:hypothetical protein [bacterium]
ATEAAPQLAQQAAAQGTLEAAARGGAEVAEELAEQGLRQPGFLTPFAEGWAKVDGPLSLAAYPFHCLSYLVDGVVNFTKNSWRGLRGAVVRSAPQVHTASVAVQAGARRVGLPVLWRGFRSTVTWRNFFTAAPVEYYHRSRVASSLGHATPLLEDYGIQLPEGSEALERSGMDLASPRLIIDRTYRLDLPSEEDLPPVDMIFRESGDGDLEVLEPQDPAFDADE